MTDNFFTIKTRKLYILSITIFLLFFLPFMDKAFHIDDAEFIYIADLIGWNPLDAAPVDYPHNGALVTNALPPYQMSHPLLVPYAIKIISAIFGKSEIMLHLVFLIFPALALVSFAILYRLFFPDSKDDWVVATLFLCSLPAFLVNAQTIMCDVPTLSFLLMSMASYAHFMERESAVYAYIGGILLCLAAFTSYQALFFCSVIAVYSFVRKKLGIHVIASLIIPVAALAVWFLLLYRTHHIFPFFKGGSDSFGSGSALALLKVGMGHEAYLYKGISALAFVGSSMLCLIPAYIVLNKSGIKFLAILIPLIAFGYYVISAITDYALSENLFLSLLAALGVLTLLIVIRESPALAGGDRDRGRGVFLMGWILLVLVYNMLIFPWIAARHILPVFPPVIMIIINSLERGFSRKKKIVLSCSIAVSILLGIGSAVSDYKLAETYRDIARDTAKLRSDNNTLWYIGEWGMHYYMDKAGARYLLADSDEPRNGDFIVLPELPRFWGPSPRVENRMDLYAEKVYASILPMRLFNRRSHAGFYWSGMGLLPFSFSEKPDEVFFIFRVNR